MYINQTILNLKNTLRDIHLEKACRFQELAKEVESAMSLSTNDNEVKALNNLLRNIAEEMRRSVSLASDLLAQPQVHLVAE